MRRASPNSEERILVGRKASPNSCERSLAFREASFPFGDRVIQMRDAPPADEMRNLLGPSLSI